MDLAAFRVRFPEFVTAADTLVSAALAAAALESSAVDLGIAYDEAHGLLAAHKLAESPFGTNARVETGKMTSYEKERNALVARVITPLGVT